MNAYLTKFLVLLALTLTSVMVKARTDGFDDVTLLARIQSVKEAEAQSGYAVKLEQDGLEHVLSHLEPEDEVLLKGSIRYVPVTHDNKTNMRPTFFISKIIPVSLKRIGESEFKVAEPELVFSLPDKQATRGFPVSAQVASSITLTATILLMQNLATSGPARGPREDLQAQVLLGSGVLATGIFIWEQFQSGRLK